MKLIRYESLLERDFVFYFDFLKDITYIKEQPTVFEVQNMRTGYTYTPDFLIKRISGTMEYIEVKPYDKLSRIRNTPNLINKYDLFKVAIESKTCSFRFMTEKDLPSTLLKNIQFLRYYAFSPPDHNDQKILTDLYNRTGSLKNFIQEAKSLFPHNILLIYTYYLIYWEIIPFDLYNKSIRMIIGGN